MITIDHDSSTAPYEQVRSQFAALINSGELAAGAKLPTVRQLAADLSLAVNTAARAYRELETAGLIETHGRAGTVVSARGNTARADAVEAAQAYAARAAALGLSPHEALNIVRAALEA